MSLELLKLKLISADKDTAPSRGFIKKYFYANIDLIFELLETYKASHSDIVEAFRADGVNISEQYFRRLIAAEKQKPFSGRKRKEVFVESNQANKGTVNSSKKEIENTASSMTPQELEIKKEVARITASDMSPQDKREALAKATAPLKNRNPLSKR